MSKSLEITVKTINGTALEFPRQVVFSCEQLVPVGLDYVRVFDENSCIVVRKLFMFRHGSDLFGSVDFKTMDEFYQFKSVQCKCCSEEVCCYVLYNGCYLTINGRRITIGHQTI